MSPETGLATPTLIGPDGATCGSRVQADLVPGMGNTCTFYPETDALLAWAR